MACFWAEYVHLSQKELAFANMLSRSLEKNGVFFYIGYRWVVYDIAVSV